MVYFGFAIKFHKSGIYVYMCVHVHMFIESYNACRCILKKCMHTYQVYM